MPFSSTSAELRCISSNRSGVREAESGVSPMPQQQLAPRLSVLAVSAKKQLPTPSSAGACARVVTPAGPDLAP